MRYGHTVVYIPTKNFLLHIFAFDPKKTRSVISAFHEDRNAFLVEIEKTLAFLSWKPHSGFWHPEKSIEMTPYQYEEETTEILNETVKKVVKYIFGKADYI